MSKKLPFLSSNRRLVYSKREPSEDALVQERLQRHQMVQQKRIRLRMPAGQVLAKHVVVVVTRSHFRETIHRPRLLYDVQNRVNNGVDRCHACRKSKRGHQEKRPRRPPISRPLSKFRAASTTPLVNLPLGVLFRPAPAARWWINHHAPASRAGVRVSSFLKKRSVQVAAGVAQACGDRT